MKHVIFGSAIISICLAAWLCVLTSDAKMTRSADLKDALDESVKTAVEAVCTDRGYSIDNAEEFQVEFTQQLMSQISNDGDLEVRITGLDYENAMLSVKAILHFENPDGTDNSVESDATVLLEAVPLEKKMCKVEYVLPDGIQTEDGALEIYKSYELMEGNLLPVPEDPKVSGKTFVGWNLSGTNQVDRPKGVVESDVEYIAVFD